MEEQEREYLRENIARLERWDSTPAAPSGRCSDMTEVEKEKLIDLLFAREEKLTAELTAMRMTIERQTASMERMSEDLRLSREASVRFEKMALEEKNKAQADRNSMQQRIDTLLKLNERLLNGEELRAAIARAEKAEKALADAKADSKTLRGQSYGRKSQKSRRDDDRSDSGERDAGQEKDSMGGKDSVDKLPEKQSGSDKEETDSWIEEKYRAQRTYRKGKKHRTMKASRRCVHISDINAVPEGWTVIGQEKRFAYDKQTVIVEHEYRYFIVRDPEGNEHVLYCPGSDNGLRWSVMEGDEEKESQALTVTEELCDKDGKPVIDRFPHTSATAGMMADLTIDHFVNNIPYYGLVRSFRDHGMSISRQTLINWMWQGGRMLGRLIPVMLDLAVEKDSIINCDETWCKVRVKGKYAKRYIWCLVNRALQTVIYFYKEGSRSRDAFKSILDGRVPKAVQTDGYNVYLYLDDELVDTEHLCCMAHARAKFHYAWEAFGEPDAEYILDIIRQLYHLENLYQSYRLSPEEIKKQRNGERVTELIIRLRSKIDAMKSADHPPRSEMLEKALRYMDEFWTQLFAYRNDGCYTIDNTLAERFMRPISGERKNSLFYGSGKMASIASVYRTLISTCRLMKVSVKEYFVKVFRSIVAGCDNLTSLLPSNMGLTVIKS